ncbi:transglutaminase family protein [Roseomonas sp. BN140053]|uniref:transglutaminase family protein n=1 Tax=Roseomonas sp. BN140053 TaxID=3391898 RepID=UPI0039EB2B16
MAPLVALTHRTRYRYARPVSLGPQTVRLRPAPHGRTPILDYALHVDPVPETLRWLADPLGNPQARLLIPGRISAFEVRVELTADLSPINPFDFVLEPEAAEWPFRYPDLLQSQLAPFGETEIPDAELGALVLSLGTGRRDTVALLGAANTLVQNRIAYVTRDEPGIWSPARTLAEGRGSCRDSAWLLVQLLRALGFAARFCSGYLVQLAEGEKPDRADLHAWAEVWLPGAGWIGLDPTSGLFTAEGHIPLAAAPEPASAAPIAGRLEATETEFSVSMTLRRVADRP